MINLYVEDYCQSCPDFEAEVDKDIDSMYRYRNTLGATKKVVETTITCKYASRCACIKTYLENGESN